MNGNFEQSLAFVIKEEGGYGNDAHDSGGMTNLGITAAVWSAWTGHEANEDEMRSLTLQMVEPLYKKNYWDKLRGDDLPIGVDYAAFDFGVNSGTARSAKYLQNICGAAQDGIIGPQTLSAVSTMPSIEVVNRLCDDRLAYLQSLTSWQYFGKGWGSRVERVRQRALKMIG